VNYKILYKSRDFRFEDKQKPNVQEQFKQILETIVSTANVYDKDIFSVVCNKIINNIGIMYVNWSEANHFHIENAEFVFLSDLMTVMRHARRINFSVKVRREETRQTSDVVRFEINQNVRAPERPFVNLTNSVFADLLDTIINALDFGERTMDFEEKTIASSKFSSINDAKIAYSRSISHITEIVSKNLSHLQPFGIFTQVTFEVNYDLEWGCEDNESN